MINEIIPIDSQKPEAPDKSDTVLDISNMVWDIHSDNFMKVVPIEGRKRKLYYNFRRSNTNKSSDGKIRENTWKNNFYMILSTNNVNRYSKIFYKYTRCNTIILRVFHESFHINITVPQTLNNIVSQALNNTDWSVAPYTDYRSDDSNISRRPKIRYQMDARAQQKLQKPTKYTDDMIDLFIGFPSIYSFWFGLSINRHVHIEEKRTIYHIKRSYDLTRIRRVIYNVEPHEIESLHHDEKQHGMCAGRNYETFFMIGCISGDYVYRRDNVTYEYESTMEPWVWDEMCTMFAEILTMQKIEFYMCATLNDLLGEFS